MSKQMDYLVILFSPPGPNNEGVEIEKIEAILKQEEGVIPGSPCKIKTIEQDVGNVENVRFIQAEMIHILRTDTKNPLAYDIFTTGFYAKGYPFFQACYAIMKISVLEKETTCKSHTSETEKVTEQIVQLIKDAINDNRDILIEDAQAVITADLAKHAEESSKSAASFIGFDAPTYKGELPGVPFEYTDRYLKIVLTTVESWLHPDISDNVRCAVSAAGTALHGILSVKYSQKQQWTDSEKEIRKTIEYHQLIEEPTSAHVATIANLAMVVNVQGRKEEAQTIIADAVTMFMYVPENATRREKVESMLQTVIQSVFA